MNSSKLPFLNALWIKKNYTQNEIPWTLTLFSLSAIFLQRVFQMYLSPLHQMWVENSLKSKLLLLISTHFHTFRLRIRKLKKRIKCKILTGRGSTQQWTRKFATHCPWKINHFPAIYLLARMREIWYKNVCRVTLKLDIKCHSNNTKL